MARLRIPGFAVMVMVIFSVSGCLSMYSTRPVEITVLDSQTQKPVSNVPVSVKYIQIMVLNPPKPVKGTTGNDGVVVLPMANFESGVIEVEAGDTKVLLTGKLVRQGGLFKDGQLDWHSQDPAPFWIQLRKPPVRSEKKQDD